jgi:hypothetical protein
MGGGGVFALSASPVVLQRVLFDSNIVSTGAGGMALLQAADVSMQDVTVTNNKVS